MKYLKYTIAFTMVTCLTIGCKKDLLVTIPNDRISTDIFWKTDNDALLAANAVYTFMSENAQHFIGTDGMSDIVYANPTGPAEALVARGGFNALNSRISDDWSKNYAGIRAANSFLGNVDRIQTTNAALITRLKGEVRTLRAYFYLRLAALYGDVPLVKTEITLEEGQQLSRNPVSEVFDFISSELTAAAIELPLTQADKGRIRRGAALGLKARAMLYAGRYQEAADAAKAVMDLKLYTLYPSYKNLFSYAAENNAEIILDIQFIKDTYSNNLFQLLAPRSLNANSVWVPTRSIVDAYQMANGKDIFDATSGYDPTKPYLNRDPRLRYSIFVPGDSLPNDKIFNPLPNSTTGDAVGSSFVVSATGFNIKKYVNKEDLTTVANNGINIILMRYAEILLIYAEAKIELNQIDNTVYDAINLIRKRPDVNMPAIAVGSTQADLRKIVRQERMVELAFEAHRFFDIRRWKIAETVMPGKVLGLTYAGTNGVLTTVEVPGFARTWETRYYLWPIPQKEIELNSKLIQNNGW
jgi:starch-binding outer membrane protein, SusD/RagB family